MRRLLPVLRPFVLLAMLALAACGPARFELAGETPPAAYDATHPYYAEYCALSQILKKPGFGFEVRGQAGGHAVFFLHGACLKAPGAYPVLHRCAGGDGVGLSMNAHFRNAAWVGVPGRDLFFSGGVPPGAPLDRGAYAAAQAEAKRLGVYDAIAFHSEVFQDMPAGWAARDWMYEVSVGTDYAIGFARGRYCVRVPATAAQMDRMVAFLNAKNAPYRAGAAFEWSVFTDNCIHLAHNALAAAGLWDPWPTGRPLALAVFDFPVPKNEFVNLVGRTNDAWLADPGQAYRDLPARALLLAEGWLPAGPGALIEAQGPVADNALYDTGVRLIFYDDPLLGPYQRRFDRIVADPRYADAGANRAYFAGLARAALAGRRPLGWWLAQAPYRGDPAGFGAVYDGFYRLMGRLAES